MGLKTTHNVDGTKTLQWVDTAENKYWRQLWWQAWSHMPNHSASKLCLLLGYTTHSKNHCHANSRIFSNYQRGSKPRLPQQQQVLKMLGGPHGTTMVKAIVAARHLLIKGINC